MIRSATFSFLLAVVPLAAVGQSTLRQSEIEANVPPEQTFQQLLLRDLLAYFRASTAPAAQSVDYELLRKQPTQSGLAYPKYYAWVKVQGPAGQLLEGAVRLAAIDRTHFEVTDFLASDQLRKSPEAARAVFPDALTGAILKRAGIK